MLGDVLTAENGFERIEFNDREDDRCVLQSAGDGQGVLLGVCDPEYVMSLNREQVTHLIHHLEAWLDYNTLDFIKSGSFTPPSPSAEKVTGWRREHPDADVPEWFDEHCEDHSWRQDTMPIFHYGGWGIFVDYADPDNSQHTDERISGRYKRFGVSKILGWESNNFYDFGHEFHTNDLEVLKAWLAARVVMVAWTDYRFSEDGQRTPVQVEVFSYDGEHCKVKHYPTGREASVKAGYLYQQRGRSGEVPVIDVGKLPVAN